MNRRDVLKYLSAGATISVISPSLIYGNNFSKKEVKYLFFTVQKKYVNNAKSNKDVEIPFNWDAFCVGAEKEGICLSLQGNIPEIEKGIKLRLTSVNHFHGKEKKVEVSIPKVGKSLGVFDLKHSPVFQISELPIEKEHISEIKKYGICLKLTKGTEPVYFQSGTSANANSQILLPHLFFTGNEPIDRVKEYFDRLYSYNSIQSFGWMEGCVLDGLWQIYQMKKDKQALKTIKEHLALFLGNGFEKQKEIPDSEDKQYKISSIETTLPFAIIGELYPEHPTLNEAMEFWKKKKKDHGGIVDYSVTAEGAYTISYPMAVLSKVLKKPELAKEALEQLKIRMKLINNENIHLRYYPDKDTRTYKNWARGIAWYLLGIVRTITILKDTEDIQELKEEFIRASEFVVKFQKPNGLWNCFIDDDSTIADTSGSAGISAAISSGINEGFIDKKYKSNVEKTWNGLHEYLTEDGLLSGVAQSNSGGEALQKSSYRVISQMGMGLMAQLYASIPEL